jgi:putative glutathione S-transferase
MHQLINGECMDTEEYSGDSDLEPTRFRDQVKADPDAAFPVETGRYHLYISWACPWSHRTILARRLKGLTDAITMDVLDPFRAENSAWQFNPRA